MDFEGQSSEFIESASPVMEASPAQTSAITLKSKQAPIQALSSDEEAPPARNSSLSPLEARQTLIQALSSEEEGDEGVVMVSSSGPVKMPSRLGGRSSFEPPSAEKVRRRDRPGRLGGLAVAGNVVCLDLEAGDRSSFVSIPETKRKRPPPPRAAAATDAYEELWAPLTPPATPPSRRSRSPPCEAAAQAPAIAAQDDVDDEDQLTLLALQARGKVGSTANQGFPPIAIGQGFMRRYVSTQLPALGVKVLDSRRRREKPLHRPGKRCLQALESRHHRAQPPAPRPGKGGVQAAKLRGRDAARPRPRPDEAKAAKRQALPLPQRAEPPADRLRLGGENPQDEDEADDVPLTDLVPAAMTRRWQASRRPPPPPAVRFLESPPREEVPFLQLQPQPRPPPLAARPDSSSPLADVRALGEASQLPPPPPAVRFLDSPPREEVPFLQLQPQPRPRPLAARSDSSSPLAAVRALWEAATMQPLGDGSGCGSAGSAMSKSSRGNDEGSGGTELIWCRAAFERELARSASALNMCGFARALLTTGGETT